MAQQERKWLEEAVRRYAGLTRSQLATKLKISESALYKKLRLYGIAPPERRDRPIACPRCSAENTELVSEFGSTACKASYRCLDCLEPFEYFKCL